MRGLRITVLGCGHAGGVPSIAHGWGACDPTNPLNRRTRPSILLNWLGHSGQERNLLVDTSPDLREQLLHSGTKSLDGVVITHVHADHTHGLDDLREVNRAMNTRVAIPLWARVEDLGELEARFGYCFTPLPPEAKNIYKPLLHKKPLEAGRAVRPVEGDDITLLPFLQNHGRDDTLGLRLGGFAYSTDVVNLDEAAFEALEGVDTWLVDCFCIQPHPTHANLERTLSWIERVKPRRAILTHMGTTLDYASLTARLPDHVVPAHDGMVIEVPLA